MLIWPLWLARLLSSFVCSPESVIKEKRLPFPAQKNRGKTSGSDFHMWLFPLSWDSCSQPWYPGGLPVCAEQRQTVQFLLGMKAQALWTSSPSFILILLFFLIQQCSVNRLDYELMQAYGLLLGQKARLCLGNDICLLAFSWKHKNLSLLSRFFFFPHAETMVNIFNSLGRT